MPPSPALKSRRQRIGSLSPPVPSRLEHEGTAIPGDAREGVLALLQFAGTVNPIDGAFDLFGAGCAQSNGQVATLSSKTTVIRAGLPFSIEMTKGPASQSFSFLAFGINDTGNLGGFLFPGTTCRVHVNPLIQVPLPTNATGVATFSAAIPASGVGLTLFTQAWGLSTGANPMNLAVSDAGVFLVSK